MYYMNPVTQQVLWQHPLDYTYQQKYLQAKAGNLPQGSDSSYKEAKPQAARHSSSKGQHSQQVSSTAVSLPKDIHNMSEQVITCPPCPPPSPQPHLQLSRPSSLPVMVGSWQDLVAVVQKLMNTKHGDLRTLLIEPSSAMIPMQCYVHRHKSRIGGTRFDFFMSISKQKDMYCFTGKKHPVAKGCYYSITLDQDESKRSKGSFIGK
ncbi:MAG: hypothetical protein SGPRY_004882, partial [Prymnesium sp.]